jgi:uncharacterized protein (AIM24 family)
MQISIKHQPSYSLAILPLASEESIQAESGAMLSMSSNFQIETAMKGGVLGAAPARSSAARGFSCCAPPAAAPSW